MRRGPGWDPLGVSWYDDGNLTAATDHSMPEFRGQAAEMQAGRALCRLLLLQVTQLVAAADIAPDPTRHRESYGDSRTIESCSRSPSNADSASELFEFYGYIQGKFQSHSMCFPQEYITIEKNGTFKSNQVVHRSDKSGESTKTSGLRTAAFPDEAHSRNKDDKSYVIKENASTEGDVTVIRRNNVDPGAVPWTTYIPWPSQNASREADMDLMTSLPAALWDRMEAARRTYVPCKGK